MVKLTIDAPSFGVKNLVFAGTATPNKVLFHNADNSLVITANRQTVTTAGGKPASITVDGLAMHFANYAYFGTRFSGDIALGSTMAN